MCEKCNGAGAFADAERRYLRLHTSGKDGDLFACRCGCPEKCTGWESDNREIGEESLNRFLKGQQLETVQPIKMYGNDRIQIWLENGSFLSIGINTRGDELDIDLLGPDPPDREVMREMWDEQLELLAGEQE